MKILIPLFFTIILATSVTLSHAQVPEDQAAPIAKETKHKKKHAEKNVKTNGKVSTSGCETASGKTLAENDFGYADCLKQIGTKK